MKNIMTMTAAMACALALTACGGGDDNGGSTLMSRADEGIWSNLDSGGALQTVILSDGSYWSLGGVQTDSCTDPKISSVLQGTANVSGSSASGTYTDFLYMAESGPANGTYSGTVSAQNTLNLTFDDPSSPGLSNTTVSMNYDNIYNQPASLSTIAGNYSVDCEISVPGPILVGSTAPTVTVPVLTISGSNLTLTGSDGSTVMKGTLTPHGAVNVFDVSLTATTNGGIISNLGANNYGAPAGTVYKGILFQTSDHPNYIEIAAISGSTAYAYIGVKSAD
jgi:hypothetical protein